MKLKPLVGQAIETIILIANIGSILAIVIMALILKPSAFAIAASVLLLLINFFPYLEHVEKGKGYSPGCIHNFSFLLMIVAYLYEWQGSNVGVLSALVISIPVIICYGYLVHLSIFEPEHILQMQAQRQLPIYVQVSNKPILAVRFVFALLIVLIASLAIFLMF